MSTTTQDPMAMETREGCRIASCARALEWRQ